MRVNHLIQFFDDPDNYAEVKKICLKYFDEEEASDVCHDIAIKLMNHENSHNFPKDREHLLRFIAGVVFKYRIDILRKKQKLPPMVNESYAVEVDTETPPTILQKMDKLNKLIQSRQDLFTEDQMKLWHLMYLNLHVWEMALLLGKTANAVCQARLTLIKKIRKHFKLSDLF